MKFAIISIVTIVMTTAAPALAQCIIGCGGAIPVYDLLTESNTGATAQSTGATAASVADIDSNELPEIISIEQQNILPGLAGGFDWSQTLQGDLEQQVSSAGGMPLVTGALAAYPTYWPGYTNANYQQSNAPDSPEGNMLTTLGTLQGALNAAADQQTSQQTEAARMTQLESEAGAAAGNLQALEVSNEIALFNGQEEIKSRNSINGQLNALLIAEANRQNQKAQDDLESMAAFGETYSWDYTQAEIDEPTIPHE